MSALIAGQTGRAHRLQGLLLGHVQSLGFDIREQAHPGDPHLRYRFREQMFPAMTFRLAYDALRKWQGERADVEYVRILHLAATTMEATVDSALALLLETGRPFDYAEVRDLAETKPPEAPTLLLAGRPDLKI